MGKKPHSQPKDDTSLQRFFETPEIREALSSLGIFVRNLVTGTAFSNYLWKHWGYTEEDLTAEKWKSIVHPDDREAAIDQYERLLSGEISSYRMKYRIRTADDQWRDVVTAGHVLTWLGDGSPELFIGADVDVTDQRSTEAELERAKIEAEVQAQEAETLRMAGAIVASTLEINQTVQLVLDQALNVVPYDTATVQLMREDALEVIGGNGWEDLDAVRGVRIPYPGDNPHSRAIKSRKTVMIGDMSNEFPQFANLSGTEIRSWLGVPLVVHQEIIGLLALESTTPNSFTEKHARMAAALGDQVAVALFNARLYEQMKSLAMTDSLTGVATRRSFFIAAQHLLDDAVRSGGTLSVLMADLDHFKRINDEYGHQAGDDAIRLAADAAREMLRRTDVIGRYGGEEFAVVLPDTGADAAMTIAERLRINVSKIDVQGTAHNLSISVGVTTCQPESSTKIDEILNMADKALLSAKRRGRNRVERYQTA
jgi:diguanylate cyclase (GGDEF)-like protein/PAS domain S-box-containing protein